LGGIPQIESKPGNKQKDSLTEVPRATETLVARDCEVEKLIGLEDDTELTPYEGMEFESEDAARNLSLNKNSKN